MKAKRRKFTAAFKAQVAIEAIKERTTLAELSKEFDVHPNMITTWKREFLENASAVFDQGVQKDDFEKERESLTNLIGRLEIERDWLKKISIKAGLQVKE
jgi:transposase-like protein